MARASQDRALGSQNTQPEHFTQSLVGLSSNRILSPAFTCSDEKLLTNQPSYRKCSFLKIRQYQLTSIHPVMVWFGFLCFVLVLWGYCLFCSVLGWWLFFGGLGFFAIGYLPGFQWAVTNDTISRLCSTLFLFWQRYYTSGGQEPNHYL